MASFFEKLAEHRYLETERLCLRPVTLDDAKAMFDYASDEETVRYSFPANQTIEETRQVIASVYLASPLGRWGIVLKATGDFIGTLDLHHIQLDLGRAEIGYCLHKHHWGRGYATEAVKAVLVLCFEALGMNCVIAKHDKDNPASGRVMAKSGMRFSHEEPYAKRDHLDSNRFVTVLHYYLTKEDYDQQKSLASANKPDRYLNNSFENS
ncbi:GNAT family N-acetyltransferase [Streptococcus equi]|uniref:GNAT family N-acetyltransferase n=1 Tax=Streptococcus equi TaxID=1336 RepID=UPI000E0605CA|nr:GNAT family N-acetyltransferase [Streptococcus equi]HEL1015337.1 GNAT family N-acetyltransferase [Streptococcus equi subsp. ruminatorum]MCD3383158.1 GNAT family N-acetyltransferase [Streptococcus equi subsp. zooepidemicus]MCD3419088.1 GNAT family N-acetyltransferase [Streptococcus equi subsp. zooepidemicus]MCD3425701.1 GNAT family N-acetyltransferase [Streptococcus equi subsp. zooepidemicus]MDI6000231.1 GNAT family N-acetyltransferase [Streptococcus equi subsp. zooepidemicus]